MNVEAITFADSYRPNSEDRVAVFEARSGIVVAVADGMGGRAGGGEAASAFIALIGEAMPAVRDVADSDAWDALLVRADRAIRDDRVAGETTAVVVGVGNSRIGGASVGDSGAWFITPERMFDLTAGQQRKPGLGTGMASPAPFRARAVPGVVLVATDGLFKYTGPENICAVVRAGPSATVGQALVGLVRMPRGGLQDDVALALCRLS